MQFSFWHNKWKKNEIGFHLNEANPLLVSHFSALNLQPDNRIFLPLCGKTLDIHWLLSQGFRVAGAELSTIAVEGLFKNLKLTPNITNIGAITRYSAQNIDIYNGDFFALTTELLGKVNAVYDRAALVALPEDMRKRYSAHLSNITRHAPQLLICFDYDQSQHAGPPFCVDANEVHIHYQQIYVPRLLASIEMEGGLKGQCTAQEQVWLLTP